MIKKQVEIKTVRNLEAIELNDKFAVAKLEVIITHNGFEKKHETQGVADINSLNVWDGVNENIYNTYALMDSSVIEKYRKYGIPGAIFAEFDWDDKDLKKLVSKTPFTDYKKGLEKRQVFMSLSQLDHSLTLLDGTVISKAFNYNYINSNLDNSKYDLEKVADILSKRDDILFLNKKTDKFLQSPLTDEQCSNLIQEIPYYNAEEDKKEYLNFFVSLPQEKFDQMIVDIGKGYSSYQAFSYILEHDLLGIKSAKLVNKEEVNKEKPKNKFRK